MTLRKLGTIAFIGMAGFGLAACDEGVEQTAVVPESPAVVGERETVIEREGVVEREGLIEREGVVGEREGAVVEREGVLGQGGVVGGEREIEVED